MHFLPTHTGASPVEVDSARGMRANEWSRLCGRYTCAEMIEKCSRAKLLETTTTSSKWARDVMINEKFPNSKPKDEYTSPASNGKLYCIHKNMLIKSVKHFFNCLGTGVKSKLSRVFPFKFSFKQKSNVSPKDRVPEFSETNGNSNFMSSTMKSNKMKSNGICRKESSVPKYVKNKFFEVMCVNFERISIIIQLTKHCRIRIVTLSYQR